MDRLAGSSTRTLPPVLQVDVPVTASQVPPSLEVVAQRKAHFLEKRRKVKANEEVQVGLHAALGTPFWSAWWLCWCLR